VKARTSFETEEAWMLGWVLGVAWDNSPFDVEEFRKGLDLELERESSGDEVDDTHLDPIGTAKAALSNLRGRPDYYTARVEPLPA
jgi:hypothetical protein